MIVYFTDKMLNVLGIAGPRDGMVITGDVYQNELDTGAPVMECYLEYPKGMRRKAERCAEPGGYVLRKRLNRYEVFTILESEGEPELGRVWMHLEGGGIDLVCEEAKERASDGKHKIADYINMYIKDSGFVIRENEFPNNQRTLSWDSSTTVMERLLSIANSFGAELEFDFDIDGLRVTGMYIDIKRKRGKVIKKPLVAGREISPIRRKRSLATFASSLRVTGGTPEGSDRPITLAGMTYDDGDIYLSQAGYLYSRTGRAAWRRFKDRSEGGGWVIAYFSYDTSNPKMLLSKSVAELRTRNHMTDEFSADILDPELVLSVGDTVKLSDPEGRIYVSARVSKIEESEENMYTTVTFGQYVNLEVEEGE